MALRRVWDRKRGHPSVQVNFRCPKELVDAAEKNSRNLSEGLIRLLDVGADALGALGSSWTDLEVYAAREGITESEAIGRLAALGLDQQRVKPKK